MEETKKFSFKQILAWTVLLCCVALVVTVYVQLHLTAQRLDREIIYRQAYALAQEEQHKRVVSYQKRFEQQRMRQEYNKGRVVGVKTAPNRKK